MNNIIAIEAGPSKKKEGYQRFNNVNNLFSMSVQCLQYGGKNKWSVQKVKFIYRAPEENSQK